MNHAAEWIEIVERFSSYFLHLKIKKYKFTKFIDAKLTFASHESTKWGEVLLFTKCICFTGKMICDTVTCNRVHLS